MRAAQRRFHALLESRDYERELPALAQFLDAQPSDGRTPRATRNDLLASVFCVGACLLARCQLRSLRVGFQRRAMPRGRRRDFIGLYRRHVAAWCDLSERTVTEAFTLLRRAGYVHGPSADKVNHIAQPCEADAAAPNGVRGLPAVRRFSFEFFTALGLGTWLAELRAGRARPAAPVATVTAGSARKLVAALADAHALDGPPDG